MIGITTLPTSHGQIALRDSGGDGLPILMIHGNSSSGAIFRHQMDGALGRRFRLLAADLPGHGDSADAIDPTRTYRMEGYADAMSEVLRRMEIGTAAVFGWSLGGHIGLEMISRFPGLLGLMITGTPPVSTRTVGQGFIPSPHMSLAGQESLNAEEVSVYAHSTCGEPFEPFLLDVVARTDGQARRMMFESFVAGTGDDQERIVATSQVPLAVVNGADEPFVNLDHVAKLRYASLWTGKTIAIDGAGHAPFWERPASFNLVFEAFFDSLKPSETPVLL